MKMKTLTMKLANILSLFAFSFIILADEAICFFIFHQPEYPQECKMISRKKDE